MNRFFVLMLSMALCIPLSMAACGGGGGGGGTEGTNSEYNSADTPQNIPDNNLTGVTSQINIAGIAGTIAKVTVDVYITHTYDEDLVIDLLSPEGTLLTLAFWAGTDGDDFYFTRFDDAASEFVWAGSAPFNGSYRPEDPLSALNGEDPNGTWELTVVDDAVDDTGTLRSWGLNID
jgi:subtilisin-like proprotein convertase family protein